MFADAPPLFFAAGLDAPQSPLRGLAATAAPAAAAVARPDAPAFHRVCCNCPTVFRPLRGRRQMFCGPACETEWRNRQTARGRQAMLLVMAARQTRDGTRGRPDQRAAGKRATALLNQLLQDWRDEDRAAGRADAIDVFALRDRLGTADR